MDNVIDQIANMVETGLIEAKKLIAAGKQEIANFVSELPMSVQKIGMESAKNIQSQFNELEKGVEKKQNALIDSLTTKYVKNLKSIDTRIEDMKQENRGLVSVCIDAIKSVINTIIELKNRLLDILSRAADTIALIIIDPIGFLGNLVSGIGQGIKNFMSNISHHLLQGLMAWLVGAFPGEEIRLPDKFDAPGIFSLVMQILQITYQAFRQRAVILLGENVVSWLETAAEIFKIFITQGPIGLWKYIEQKISDLKSVVFDTIKDFVEQQIISAGITWLLSLLNPVSAFIKAVKGIIGIVTFFIERGKQIMDLVSAIIDSVAAIAKGNISEAANFVEMALARSIPVLIGFLAALIGLNGITEKVRSIIESVRKPIVSAMDWVILQAAKLFKKGAGLLGFGKKEQAISEEINDKKIPDTRKPEEKQQDVQRAIKDGTELLKQNPNMDGKSLKVLKNKYRLKVLEIRLYAHKHETDIVYIHGEASPGQDGEQVTIWNKLPPVSIQFKFNKENKNLNIGEYCTQLRGQQEGLNKMNYKVWKDRRTAYLDRLKKWGDGRDPLGDKAQASLRKQKANELILERKKYFTDKGMPQEVAEKKALKDVNDYMKGVHALHNPDQIIGGDPGNVLELGNKAVNSSIGRAWGPGGKAEELEKKIDLSSAEISIEDKNLAELNTQLILSI